jgi:hypothetical protein
MSGLPAWWRRPGESLSDWEARCAAIYAESQRREDEAREHRRATVGFEPGMTDLACGVGTYDCNGNPKGSGW